MKDNIYSIKYVIIENMLDNMKHLIFCNRETKTGTLKTVMQNQVLTNIYIVCYITKLWEVYKQNCFTTLFKMLSHHQI